MNPILQVHCILDGTANSLASELVVFMTLAIGGLCTLIATLRMHIADKHLDPTHRFTAKPTPLSRAFHGLVRLLTGRGYTQIGHSIWRQGMLFYIVSWLAIGFLLAYALWTNPCQ